ncbi:MAG: tetratricopeptide repeat protein [Deltaproteobacteria bacterium]
MSSVAHLLDATKRTAVRATFAAHVVVAIVLAFVPLFDALGFERAFVSGLLTAVTSPIVASSLLRRARDRGGEDPARVFFHALLVNAFMLLPTVVAGYLVEWVAQPCDPEEGLAFVVLVAGGNAVMGTALGVAGGALAYRRGVPFLAITATLLAFLFAALSRLYEQPQIFVYSAPFGYWPGSIYDEELAVDPRLVGFRVYSTLLAFTILATARLFIDRRTLLVTTQRLPLLTLLGAVTLGLLTYRAHDAGDALGFDLDRRSIEQRLSHVERTEHFVIHIDPTVTSTQARLIREDHEFRYAQLEAFFGGGPDGTIKSFVYRDTQQKAALMGAGRTQVARPWEREIHLNGFDFPHRVVKHELAHVFAGRIASGPFKVPTTSVVFVNIGIVEGIAVAADWRVNELTVHGWTRAMKELDLLPDLRRGLDVAGFWSLSSSRAYTAAGSFVRYLIDTYGMEKFAVLYRDNDFDRAYGRSLDGLVTEWEGFVERLPLSPDDLLIAEHRFRRPSIFQKVCAHRAANLASSGYAKLGSGDVDGGIEDLEALVRYAPGSTRPLLAISAALATKSRLDEAEAYAQRALDADGTTEKSRALAKETLGALAWRRGRLEDARGRFEEVLRLHLSTPSDRLQSARLHALERPPEVQAVLRAYLTQGLSPAAALVRLGALVRSYPDDPLAAYLYTRALENADLHEEALAQIESVGPDLAPPLAVEARLTRGRLLFATGRFEAAQSAFDAVAADAESPGIAQMARDWSARSRFARGDPE